MSRIFQDIAFQSLKKGLDAYTLRHKVITDNVANVQTPGFKAKQLLFESILRKKIEGFEIKGRCTHKNHIPLGKINIGDVSPEVIYSEEEPSAGMVNNVDIEKEMVNLGENNIMYQASVQLLSYKYKIIALSITGRI